MSNDDGHQVARLDVDRAEHQTDHNGIARLDYHVDNMLRAEKICNVSDPEEDGRNQKRDHRPPTVRPQVVDEYTP